MKDQEKKKIWGGFNLIIIYYRIQLNQIIISNGISSDYLTDFPNNLPNNIKNEIEKDKIIHNEITKIINESYDRNIKIKQTMQEISKELFSNVKKMANPLTYAMIDYKGILTSIQQSGLNPTSFPDFNVFLKNQIIILFYALLDGLLSQLIEIIAELNPSITPVKSKKIKKRINFIVKNCNIPLDKHKGWSDTLTIIEEIRHILVHKMGIIDNAFLEKTKIPNLKIGDRIIVQDKTMGQIAISIPLFVATLQQAISEKYFSEFL